MQESLLKKNQPNFRLLDKDDLATDDTEGLLNVQDILAFTSLLSEGDDLNAQKTNGQT